VKKYRHPLLRELRGSRTKKLQKAIVWSVVVGLSGVVGILLFVLSTYLNYIDGLVVRERLVNRQLEGVQIFDRSGELIYSREVAYRFGEQRISELPPTLIQATVAIEDRDFYAHVGFSIPSMVRAFFANSESGEIVQGGSTITQQLVKNALLNDRSQRYIRKFREVSLAFALEYRYSKDELLEMYLNSIYYGRGAWGIGDAAKVYFGKEATQLSDAEAIYLAGLPQSPSVYGNDLKKAKERQLLVLNAMKREGFLRTEKAEEVYGQELGFAAHEATKNILPLATAAIIREISSATGLDMAGMVAQGLKIQTTIDAKMQLKIKNIVQKEMSFLSRYNAQNVAGMLIEKDGSVRCYLGSKDWFDDGIDGKVDVLRSLQQPGSSLKPIIFAAAIESQVLTADTLLQDTRRSFNGYVPVNFDGRYRGELSARRALANSYNVPAVEVLERVGIQTAVEYLARLGYTAVGNYRLDEPDNQEEMAQWEDKIGLSLALGGYEIRPQEHIGAYTALQDGVWNKPRLIVEVTDRTGRQVYKSPAESRRVFTKSTVDQIWSALSDNELRKEAFGSDAEFVTVEGKQIALKTGTTTGFADSWTVGYDKDVVLGFWVGNNDNSSMLDLTGAKGAGRVWKAVMSEI
jgi:penicillin-binding protein 1A